MFYFEFKKVSIVILVLFLFSAKLFSQTYSNKVGSSYGFTLGLTSTNLVNDSVKYKSGILFSGGFAFAIALNDRLNIGAEIVYTGKAFKNDSPIIKYRYYYVDVPVYLEIELSESFRINAGGQYSKFINSQRVVLDGRTLSGSHTYLYDNIKDQDYSLLLGTEIDLNTNFALGVRYTLSGSTLFEKNKPNFGVLLVNLKYTGYRSYRQLFHKKEKTI